MTELPIDIEVAEAVPQLGPDEVNHLLLGMDEETRDAIRAVFESMVMTVSNKRGTMVVVMDVHGVGHAQMLALGNTELVPYLLESSKRIADHMYKPNDGERLQ